MNEWYKCARYNVEPLKCFLFQHLLGPIIDLELLNPDDVVPTGVTVAIKHFLKAPQSSEEVEALE